MSKALLITRPGHEPATNYLLHWSMSLIEMARDKNFDVSDLLREKANKIELTGRMKKIKPSLVVLNGHGSSSTISGHDDAVLVDSSNANILSDAVIYARSCDSAAVLGQTCVDNGAKAYIGYIQPFWLCYDLDKIQHPLKDRIAAYVLEPSNQVVISLLKDHSASEASERSKKASRRKMIKLMSSDAPSHAATYVKFIWLNMKNQVCLGDTNATA